MTDLGIDHVYVEHNGSHVFIAKESLSFLSDYLQLATAVDEGAEATAVPVGYALSQNYPNPFNPTTRIDYQLADSGHTTLTIYDILGQETIRLVDKEQPPGRYSVLWDGRDGNGQQVAAGVYLCRFKAGDFKQTKKISFIK
jgi:hypothetical protein